MAGGSIAYICSIPFIMPWIVGRWGQVRTVRRALFFWIAVGLSFPLIHLLAYDHRAMMWTGLVIQYALRTCGNMVWP